MNAKTLATILLRCLGIYVLIIALGHLGSAFQIVGYVSHSEGLPDTLGMFISQSLYALLILALSIVLLFHTELVERFVTRGVAAPGDALEVGSFIHPVGLSILGAWVLSFAIPRLVFYAVKLVALGERSRRPELASWWGENWARVVESFVQVALGLLLFLASTKIVQIWTRAQRGDAER